MQTDQTITDLIPEGVPRNGRSVLFTAPTPKVLGDLPRRALADRIGGEEALIAASTRESAPTMERTLSAAGMTDPVGVIDATPKRDDARDDPDRLRWTVLSPGDLTGTSIVMEKGLSALGDRVAGCHLLYDSLSSTMKSADADRVVRFVDHVNQMTGGVNAYVAHSAVLTDLEMARLKTAMDAAVEVRKKGGDRQVRCRRLPGAPGNWTTLGPVDRSPSVAPSD